MDCGVDEFPLRRVCIARSFVKCVRQPVSDSFALAETLGHA